jgi:putative ABC transport system permease protein
VILRDLRFAARMLVRSPFHTAVAVMALGLGIGLPGLMFSIAQGLFLRGLPFEEPDRLVQLDSSNLSAGIERMPLAIGDYLSLRSRQSAFEDLAAWAGVAVVAGGAGEPAARFNGAHISANLLPLLRVQPRIGRGFDARDELPEADLQVLISEKIWRGRYGGDRRILGRQIRINGELRTVVGVMPPGFHFPLSQDFWLPLVLDPQAAERGVRVPLQGVGRLREGRSLRAAQSELATLAAGLAHEDPETHQGVGFVVRPYIEAYSDPQMRSYLQAMLGAALAVLVIACANMANLQASRMAQRTEEIAVRQALGAGRLRLGQQFLIEAALLAICGGALGLLLTTWGSDLVHHVLQPMLRSFWIDIRVDPTVLGFLIGLTGLAAVLGGCVPALRIARPDVVARLRGEGAGRRASRLARGLVIAQIALAFGLLIPTALLIQSLKNISHLDYGVPTDRLVVAAVSLPGETYSEPQASLRFFDELSQRMATRPGVRGVALASSLPHQRPPFAEVAIEGDAALKGAQRSAGWSIVSSGFFELASAVTLEGRTFLPSDDAKGIPVAVVTRSFAEQWSPGRSLVGRRLLVRKGQADPVTLTVVGVVSDLYKAELPQRGRGFLPVITRNDTPFGGETVFVPFAQNPLRSPSLLVRTEGPADQLVPEVRSEVAAIDSDVLTVSSQAMEDLLADALWDYRFFGKVFAVFGGAAFVLALIGLLGVLSLSVRRRTREIGIRIALGAQRGHVLRKVLGEGLLQLAAGVLSGSALAAVLSRAMASLFFGTAAWNNILWLGTFLLFLFAGAISCLVPGLRAMAVDPLTALRSDGN